VLRGYRRRPAADTDALARVIVSISQLASRPEVGELEINPLLVQARGHGVVAVDALVRLREHDSDAAPARQEAS
jgi:acetate---CoA ligase (ADP-forming)